MKSVFSKIVLLLATSCLLVSCDQFYFSDPLPTDAKNSYEFPREARGSWDEEGDSIVIGKNYLLNVGYHEKKVALSEVRSSSRYQLKGNKVYVVDEDKGLKAKRGFPFKAKRDTIFYLEAEVFELTLGPETFLRKGEQVYLLNSRHGNQWYEIFIIDLNDPEKIIIRYLNADDLDQLTNIERLHTAQNQYFLEANWTKRDITTLIQKGVFSDTLLVLHRKKRN